MKPIINRFWSESICGISSCPWLSHHYLVWEKYDLSNDGTSIDNRNEILLRISSNFLNKYEVQIQFIYSKNDFLTKRILGNGRKYGTSQTRLVEAWILFLNFGACWEFQCLPWTFAAVFLCLRTFRFLSIFLIKWFIRFTEYWWVPCSFKVENSYLSARIEQKTSSTCNSFGWRYYICPWKQVLNNKNNVIILFLFYLGKYIFDQLVNWMSLDCHLQFHFEALYWFKKYEWLY